MANTKSVDNIVKTIQQMLKLQQQITTRINQVSDFLEHGIPESKEVYKSICEAKERDLNEIAKSCVDAYYENYRPKYYHKREGSLYTAYKVGLFGNKIDIKLSAEFMQEANGSHAHRVDNEYLYDTMFVKGYHGGATKGDDHPAPGTPYWRKPPPNKSGITPYTEWGKPAVKEKKSPYKMITTERNNYFSKRGSKIVGHSASDVFNSIWNPYADKYPLYLKPNK